MDQTAEDTLVFEPLTDTRAILGESPVWSPLDNGFWWIDIGGRKLMRTELTGTTAAWGTPEMPGFVQYVAKQIIVGMESGIFAFHRKTGEFERLAALPETGVRFNDACTDAMGRIWAGTMDLDNQRDNGVLYLFDTATASLVPKLEGFRTINGLAMDEDHIRLFVSDSHPSLQTVWTCKLLDEFSLGRRELFTSFELLDGRPDGAVVDAKGHYWIAGVDGAMLYRFSPDGQVSRRHKVPVMKPTKPAFGPDGVMVLTSFKDDHLGGRLLVARRHRTSPPA